ncbi:MAG: T9SS type A sorting domain-containing protein [Bacteroidales bacterium]|nr:T9SS type A sorting domain-containing protein [Bacteroidales bacterium]
MQQNKTIDLSDFESGIYIISIQTDRKIFTRKVVKE